MEHIKSFPDKTGMYLFDKISGRSDEAIKVHFERWNNDRDTFDELDLAMPNGEIILEKGFSAADKKYLSRFAIKVVRGMELITKNLGNSRIIHIGNRGIVVIEDYEGNPFNKSDKVDNAYYALGYEVGGESKLADYVFEMLYYEWAESDISACTDLKELEIQIYKDYYIEHESEICRHLGLAR